MSETTMQRPPDQQIHHSEAIRRRNRWLWFGLASGPIVYSLYFLIGYFLAEAACVADLLRYRIFGLEAISFWITVLTASAAAITLFSTVVAFRQWWRTREDDEATAAERSYPPFMAFVGAWLSGIFTIFILLSGVPAFFLVICDWI
jgi:hypothetical protein